MKIATRQTTTTATLLTVGLLVSTVSAFTTAPVTNPAAVPTTTTKVAFRRQQADRALVRFNKVDDRDDEISRLREMAAKLRAEAAVLEAEQRTAMASAVEHAFDKFDKNKDGQISVQELKEGLEKVLKTELSQKRVEQLMQEFDASGDGALQLDEMVSVDQFRNKLDAFEREEKEKARQEAKKAQEEQQAYQLIQASLELINDKEPTGSEKILSVLPYLFPFLDGLQFAGPLIVQNAENPVAQIGALLYAVYRSIPFGGFIAFIALNFLSGNPTINRLIRFNMQQAIFLDIALFIPALLGTVLTLVGSTAGIGLSPEISQLGSDAIFATMMLCVTYASISSLLGITPNKIPLISDAVERRMPTFEILNQEGKILTPEERKEAQKALEKKKQQEEQKTNGEEK